MASGVKVDDSVKETYQQISLNSSKSTKLKFAIFTFSSNYEKIIVEKSGSKADENWQYEKLISLLPPDDVRYIAYDFAYVNKDDVLTSKMILLSWHPESCPIKKKMLVSSSFNTLKTTLNVSQNVIEADTLSELSTECVLEKLKDGKKAANE